MKKRGRRVTLTGRVVYDRPVHKFNEKDVFRVIRAVLDENIENPFNFISSVFTLCLRFPLTVFRKTAFIRKFIQGLLNVVLPKILTELFGFISEYGDEFVVLLVNRVLSWVSGVAPSRVLEREQRSIIEEEGEHGAADGSS